MIFVKETFVIRDEKIREREMNDVNKWSAACSKTLNVLSMGIILWMS